MSFQDDRDWIIELAREFSNSNWSTVEIRTPGAAIALSDGTAIAGDLGMEVASASQLRGGEAQSGDQVQVAGSHEPVTAPKNNTAQVEVETIEAPGVGTFWGRPKPDEPPFVQEGTRLKPGDVVGLLEVMKMFTEIKADREGKVVRVVPDGTFVEYGEEVVGLSVGVG